MYLCQQKKRWCNRYLVQKTSRLLERDPLVSNGTIINEKEYPEDFYKLSLQVGQNTQQHFDKEMSRNTT